MVAGSSDALTANVAAATVFAPPVAALAAAPGTTPAAAGDTLPAALSDNDAAAAATTAAAAVTDRTADPDDPKAAMNLAKDKVKEAWKKLPEVFPDAFLIDGIPIAYFTSSNDTQAYINMNSRLKQVPSYHSNTLCTTELTHRHLALPQQCPGSRTGSRAALSSTSRRAVQIVISFRGTQRSVRDWVTDLRLSLNSITADEATGALRIVADSEQRDSGWRSWLGPIAPLTRPALHRGFYLGYR